MKRVVGDAEANGLFDFKTGEKPSVIHCAVFKDLDTMKKTIFVPRDWHGRATEYYKGRNHITFLDKLPEYLKAQDQIWMHNGIGYDRPLIKEIFDYEIPIQKMRDSLMLSRFANHVSYAEDDYRLRKRHSVEYWADWLGLRQKKVQHEDWSQFSIDMLIRCDADVEIQERIVRQLWTELKEIPERVIQEETLFSLMLQEMHEDGFYLYEHRTERALNRYKSEIRDLERRIRSVFPPKQKLVKSFEAKFRKPKNKEEKTWAEDDPRLLHKKSREYLEERNLPLTTKTFDEYQDEEFNIGSPNQRIERLLEVGWKPINHSKATGAPSSPKAGCESLEDPDLPDEAKLIGQWLLKNSRVKTIEGWLKECDENGYVHGKIHNVGAWTHRCSHTKPNMGNIPGRPNKQKGVTKADVHALRGCWGVEPEKVVRLHDDMPVLVGCDAAGIQGRALAHYIAQYTGQDEYVKLVSDPEVDLHVYNQEAAGLETRDQAKTFYYSYVLGVGWWKIAKQVGVDEELYPELLSFMNQEGIKDRLTNSLSFTKTPLTDENYAIATRGYQIKEGFEANVPGLKEFQTKHIFDILNTGRVVLPDGRYLAVSQKPHVMAALLQGFEAVVMRRTGIEMRHHLKQKGVPFKIRNFVHDEYQYETIRRHAYDLRVLFQERIEAVRRLYKISCPLGVEVKRIADTSISWAGTH